MMANRTLRAMLALVLAAFFLGVVGGALTANAQGGDKGRSAAKEAAAAAKRAAAPVPNAPAAPGVVHLTGTDNGFGYTFFDQLSPQANCSFAFANISATGIAQNALVTNTDDGFSGPLNLGFTFPYYGVNQTQVFMGTNGYLTFGAGSTSLFGACPLSAGLPNNIIAGVWDDLFPGAGPNMFIQSFASGACPGGRTGACFIAQWQAVPYFSPSSSTTTFEIILRENGFIEVLIPVLQVPNPGGGNFSTTGIENASGTIFVQYACNNGGVTPLPNNTAVTFVPPMNLRVQNTGPAVAIQGQNATNLVTATNQTTSTTVTNLTVQYTLPANSTFVSATPSAGGICGAPVAGVVTCTWAGTTGIGVDRTITVIVTAATNCTGLTSVATVSGTVACSATSTALVDANPADNTVTSNAVCAAPPFDASIQKTGPITVAAGAAISYNITATVSALGPATDLVIQDILPANITFVSAIPSAGGTCPPPVGQTVTCTWLGQTLAGGTRTVTINGTVCASQSCNTTTTNTATVSATGTDNNPANNSASTIAQPSAVIQPPSVGGFGVGEIQNAESDLSTEHGLANDGHGLSGSMLAALLAVLLLIGGGLVWSSRS